MERIQFYLGNLPFKKLKKTEHIYSDYPTDKQVYIKPVHDLIKRNNLSNRHYILHIGDNSKKQSSA